MACPMLEINKYSFPAFSECGDFFAFYEKKFEKEKESEEKYRNRVIR